VYEIADKEDAENMQDLINIEIGGRVGERSQHKITAVSASISDSNEALGALMNNRK